MKQWFKYEFGFVNLDSENFYLTNSGNWSETENLKEKTKAIVRKNRYKSVKVIGFIVIVFCFLAFLIFKNMISGKFAISLLILTVFGGYKFYEYIKTEIGSQFKIPLEKISGIKKDEDSIEIIFENGEGDLDSYILRKIEIKGLLIIDSLNLNFNT